MSLKNAGVATVRFGQIKKKLGWKSGDTATAGASVTSSFSTIDKVTKRKATTTGSARVKRAQKASANGEDAIDDEEESGDVDNKLDAEDEMKDDAADEIKHKDAGQRYVKKAHKASNTSQKNTDKEIIVPPTCWRR